MYEYYICNSADEDAFQKQCHAIENKVSPLKKGKLIVDVDESKMQSYYCEEKEIFVYISYYEDDVHIKSDIQLEQFFE